MKKVIRNNKGFTLLEIIVVLAVLGALAAMLSPVVFRYIDDANRARAQADVSAISDAINGMYRDTGRWAYYADGSGSGTGPIAWATGDADFLTSNDSCASASTDLATCDTTIPDVAGATGFVTNTKTNSLSNELMENGPVFATTGNRSWRGPYLQTLPPYDPWGRSYLVNIKDTTTGEAVLVVSAGLDGIVQTSANQAGASNAAASGDDIVARIK